MRNVIAIIGPSGSGKTYLANQIRERHLLHFEWDGCQVISFADSLKDCAKEFLDYSEDDKEQQRQKLIDLGFALKEIDDQAIIRAMVRRINFGNQLFVVPDVRFREEVEFLNKTFSTQFVLIYDPNQLEYQPGGFISSPERLSRDLVRLHNNGEKLPSWIKRVIKNDKNSSLSEIADELLLN